MRSSRTVDPSRPRQRISGKLTSSLKRRICCVALVGCLIMLHNMSCRRGRPGLRIVRMLKVERFGCERGKQRCRASLVGMFSGRSPCECNNGSLHWIQLTIVVQARIGGRQCRRHRKAAFPLSRERHFPVNDSSITSRPSLTRSLGETTHRSRHAILCRTESPKDDEKF